MLLGDGLRVRRLLLLGVLCAGCLGPTRRSQVGGGRADNFRSVTAREYRVSGQTQVTLEPTLADADPADRDARARALADAKGLAIVWFLNIFLAEKDEELDANASYGGWGALARNGSLLPTALEPIDPLTYRFDFEVTIVGGEGLLDMLPGPTQADGTKPLELLLPQLSPAILVGRSWQLRYNPHTWDPRRSRADALESVLLSVADAPRSADAYLDYTRLFEDDRLDIGVQIGWDDDSSRSDLSEARALYETLRAAGFQSPVEQFGDLDLGSPPLQRNALWDGRTIDVSVRLVHPGMVGDPARDGLALRDALIDLLATREVVLYNGHAGITGALNPADFQRNPRSEIQAAEIARLRLHAGYQIVLVDGCKTYAGTVGAFAANPAKRGPDGGLVDLNLVTTTSFRWSNQTDEVLATLLFVLAGRSADQPIEAASWDDVLYAVSSPPNDTAFFGVSGIDDNPRAHPLGHPELLGAPCRDDPDCGGPGNACTAGGCATLCLGDDGCPVGYRCLPVSDDPEAALGCMAGDPS
jgi:hypothetical protein